MTDDGVSLAGVVLDRVGVTGQGHDHASDLAIVVGHGITNHVRTPAMRRILPRLSRTATVVAFDFRGHGRSGGASTAGDAEVLDLAAAVAFARARGHRRVATLGFSMGASIVLRHAAGHGPGEPGVDAAVAVSSPARWWVRETPAMRRVHWLLEQPHGRLAGRALGVRIGPPSARPPASPVEVVHRIAPTPLLLVHGERDHYLTPDHAVALRAAAGPEAELWLEPGMRHAETAMTPDLVDRMASWLAGRSGTPVRAGRSNRTEKDDLAA